MNEQERVMRRAGWVKIVRAADALGTTVQSVHRHLDAGRLPGAKRIGRAWYIPIAALYELVGDTPMRQSIDQLEGER